MSTDPTPSAASLFTVSMAVFESVFICLHFTSSQEKRSTKCGQRIEKKKDKGEKKQRIKEE